MKTLIDKAKKTQYLTHSELCEILSNSKLDNDLFSTADYIRHSFVGDEIYLRALIEFSNICKNNCLYCGLRKENSNIERYTLTKNEILASAQKAISYGFKTIVLQSGESSAVTPEELCSIIKELKKHDIAITLSIGEKTFDEYKELKLAGADRFLLRIETTDKNLYEKMHPKMSYENRVKCLLNLKKLGYEVGTGCLVGLPNQTIESLANDILFFKELNADMIGIGPLIVHENTPLKTESNGNFNLALKVMALTRLLLPYSNIPATTAMETIKTNGQILALQSGANVIMPNFTENLYQDKYCIYPNKNIINYNKEFTCKYEQLGRTINMSKGNSKNWQLRNKKGSI